MITAAIGWITSRKWVMELILAAVVAGLIWLGCNHLIDVGVQRQKDADKVEYDAQLAARLKQWESARVDDESRRQALQTQLSSTQANIDKLIATIPRHAVTHDTTSTEPCPPLRLDTDWLRAFAAAGTAATVPYPSGSPGELRADVPAQP